MKIFLLIIFTSLSVCIYSAVNPANLFDQANKEYKAERYDSAVQIYLTIKSAGFESAPLFYNLGNSYYKLRNYPQAILYFERALLLDPGNANIMHNLARAKMYNIDKIDEIPEFIIKHWQNRFIGILSSNRWALTSLITFICCLGLFLIYFLTMIISLKKSAFYAAVLLFIISTTSFYFSSEAKKMIQNNTGAIVISPIVTVRSSPQNTGTSLFIIHEGTKVYITGKLDNWKEIRLADGKQGWLQSSDIEEI